MAFGKASRPAEGGNSANSGAPGDSPRVKIPAARPADWPSINTEIVIVLPRDGGVFRTRVSEHDRVNGQFLLIAPESAVEDLRATPGEKMMATWTTSAGLHELKTELVDTEGEGVQWKVEPTSPVIVHERRRFPRVRRTGAIKLEAGTRAISATMLDLSEGGARCVVDTTQQVPPDMVSTTLNLDNKAIKIKGWVAWKKQHGKHTEIGVSFAGVSKKDAEILRRYVMALNSVQSRKAESPT